MATDSFLDKWQQGKVRLACKSLLHRCGRRVWLVTLIATQHLTAPERLSCRKLNSLPWSAAELQQTAQSVVADSQLKLQSVGFVDHTVVYPFSHAKGQVLCLPWNMFINFLFHEHLHQTVSLVVTNRQLSFNKHLAS